MFKENYGDPRDFLLHFLIVLQSSFELKESMIGLLQVVLKYKRPSIPFIYVDL